MSKGLTQQLKRYAIGRPILRKVGWHNWKPCFAMTQLKSVYSHINCQHTARTKRKHISTIWHCHWYRRDAELFHSVNRRGSSHCSPTWRQRFKLVPALSERCHKSIDVTLFGNHINFVPVFKKPYRSLKSNYFPPPNVHVYQNCWTHNTIYPLNIIHQYDHYSI